MTSGTAPIHASRGTSCRAASSQQSAITTPGRKVPSP
jgi:hypothetical protein